MNTLAVEDLVSTDQFTVRRFRNASAIESSSFPRSTPEALGREGGFHFFEDRIESGWIANRKLGESFAIQAQVGFI